MRGRPGRRPRPGTPRTPAPRPTRGPSRPGRSTRRGPPGRGRTISRGPATVAEGARPRRVRRSRRRSRPRARRLRTVPTGQPSRWAASALVRPSRSQSRTASRYPSGSRSTSSSTASPSSCRRSETSSTARPAARRSWRSRRLEAARAHIDVRPRDLMEPRPDRIPAVQAPGPTGEHQEGRLESVLRRVPVAQHRAARPQDHRAVPIHQRPERRFRRPPLPTEEPPQQLPVREPPRPSPPSKRSRTCRKTAPSPLIAIAPPFDAPPTPICRADAPLIPTPRIFSQGPPPILTAPTPRDARNPRHRLDVDGGCRKMSSRLTAAVVKTGRRGDGGAGPVAG